MRNPVFRFPITALLVAGLVAVQPMQIGIAEAGMIGTDAVVSGESDERARISNLLGRDVVRDALLDNGVTVEEARARIAAFSDAEVALLASHIADDPAGEGLLSAVVLGGVIGLLVLLVADLSGQSDIF